MFVDYCCDQPIGQFLYRIDHVRCHILECRALHTHLDIERKAPGLLIRDGLVPGGVLHTTRIHDGKFVVRGRLDNAEVAVHILGIIVLLKVLSEVLVADEDALLQQTCLGRRYLDLILLVHGGGHSCLWGGCTKKRGGIPIQFFNKRSLYYLIGND